ncbi:MAG: sulfite exporter TauE/SafE family protein [Nitrospinota bacterium]
MKYEPFFFLTGLISSFHCIGMCGTFGTSLLSGSPSPVKLQLFINFGRCIVYIAIGAAAGATGGTFEYDTVTAKAFLGTFALFCAIYGVSLIGGKEIFSGPPLLKKIFPFLLPVRSPLRAFSAGALLPMLPCPLLHAAVSLAILSGDMKSGALAMLFFGAGTSIPVFFSSVLAGELVKKTGAYHIRAAGGLMVLSSLLFLGRIGG